MSSILFRVSPLNYYINLSVFSDQVISVSVNFSLLDLVDFTVTLLFLLPEGVLDLNLKVFVDFYEDHWGQTISIYEIISRDADAS